MSENVFEFRVLDPELRKGSGTLDLAYWTYRIRAHTTLPTYPRREMEALRRYSDFEWLRQQLCEAEPFCIVPPIPEKDVQGTLNKLVGSASEGAARLRDYRQRALRQFLVRVGAHPRLQSLPILQDFLEMDESEWERKMKATQKTTDRFFSTALGEGVNHALTRQWNSSSNNSSAITEAGKAYSRVITDGKTDAHVWEETRLYIQQLEDSIKMLRERVQMLVDRRRSTSKALYDFGVAFEKVGEVEKGIESTSLSDALIAVGQHSETLSSIYVEHAGDETKQVVETLSYYYGMCAAARETLKRVQHAVQQVNSIAQNVQDLIAQKEKATTRGQTERVVKLENELKAMEERLELAAKSLKDGEIIFKDELQRFHRDKQYDVKLILKTFAELQLKYAVRMRETWEKLLPTVENVQLED
ncbi:putative phosphoinositide-binding protein [Trypanosoma theileri]|uniref:Putative phosphoinositide-binding protein n=1 Tax=Trypanosoma theileri TaxID=67003 RepID=A0A1X0P5K9_9TRYP|nr:putative phosphoinositide-binding protein [Trypanosoma theileri]ORC92234.1 putative phosphoinositide-binding protein [Trypanosoma theileri]